MKFYTRRRVSPVITIVSLVDILTMVLMFFVYTTTFKTAQEQVKIVLPTVGSSGTDTATTSPVVLAVTKEGEVFLDNKPVAVGDLGDAVKKLANDKRSLQMKADTDANFGKVMEVLDALKLAGASNVTTLTQQKNKRPITPPDMILDIVKYGDPILQTKGKPVPQVDDGIRQLAQDMTETMYAARGLGLAAQQIGVALQMTVVDVALVQEDRPSTMTIDGRPVDLAAWMPLVLLNPRLKLGLEKDVASEGCLSFPEIHGDVPRSSFVTVQAGLLDGKQIEFEATGMLARAIQHEVDHLHGVLYISRMNSAAKASLSGRLKRLHREGAANPSKGKPRPAKRQPAKAVVSDEK